MKDTRTKLKAVVTAEIADPGISNLSIVADYGSTEAAFEQIEKVIFNDCALLLADSDESLSQLTPSFFKSEIQIELLLFMKTITYQTGAGDAVVLALNQLLNDNNLGYDESVHVMGMIINTGASRKITDELYYKPLTYACVLLEGT